MDDIGYLEHGVGRRGTEPRWLWSEKLKGSGEAALDSKTLKTVRGARREPPTVPVGLGLGDVSGMQNFQCPSQESPGPTGTSCSLYLHKKHVS